MSKFGGNDWNDIELKCEGMVDEVWIKRWGSLKKNPSYVLAKKIMIWTLDLLPSYKFFILFIRLEMINLTLSPTTFLYAVIISIFHFWKFKDHVSTFCQILNPCPHQISKISRVSDRQPHPWNTYMILDGGFIWILVIFCI